MEPHATSDRAGSVACGAGVSAMRCLNGAAPAITSPGGIGPVRIGQAGEASVRSAHDTGPKSTAVINGRTRIFDGLTDTAVSEVKNVGSQSLTQQLRETSTSRRVQGGSSTCTSALART